MEYRFAKLNPSGNTTVLILDRVPREKHKEVSKKVMEETALWAEQVGFLEPPDNPQAFARLQMMGGEFCGNASRCLAAWIALGGFDRGYPTGFQEEEKIVPIEVSGHKGVLSAKITNSGQKNACMVSVEMPIPIEILHDTHGLPLHHSIVVFSGILHVILWDQPRDESYVEKVRNHLNSQGLDDSCFGVLFYDSRTARMIPVVYVGEVDSLVWENSCGSGTVALVSAMADKEKRSMKNFRISQPGGDLYADIVWEDGIKSAYLYGDVIITAVGAVFVE